MTIIEKHVSSELGITFLTDEPIQDLADLSHIVLNLRHHTKLFDKHFGFRHRNNKKYWEAKLDEWLENHMKNKQ